MRVLIKIVSFVLVFVHTINYLAIYSSASSFNNILLLDELDINTDFSVTVSNTYTENKCIEQADANENGYFATLTCYVAYAQDRNKENVFLKKFVDVFDNKGEFICEITFITKLDPILRMSKNYVYIIFYETVLIFDIVNRETKYYSIDPDSIVREPVGTIKRGNEFEIGKWKYKLSKHQSLGYRQFVRYTDTESQVLIDIPIQFDYGYLLTIFCVGFVVIAKMVHKIRKPSKATNQKPIRKRFCDRD